MSDDLHPLRNSQNNSLVRLLPNRVRWLCGSAGDLCQAVKAATGNTPVPADPAKEAGQGGDIGGSESGGVKP